MYILIWATLFFSVGANCKAEHNSTTTAANRTDVKQNISGKTAVKEHDALNLALSGKGPHPSSMSCTKLDSNKTLSKNGNATFTLSVSDGNATHSVQYICSEVHLKNNEPWKDLLMKVLTDPNLKVIIAFISGILLSAVIFCMICTCHRKRKRSSGKMAENLEMATIQAVPLIEADQTAKDDGACDQEAAVGGAEDYWQSAPNGDVEPKEAEYSDLDFSRLKMKTTDTMETPNPTETEYAEIKKEVAVETIDDDGGQQKLEMEEMLEGNKEEAMIEDKEREQCILGNEEEGEDLPLYSSVDEIMDQI